MTTPESSSQPDFDYLVWEYSLKSDHEILALLEDLPILPDENDPHWWGNADDPVWKATDQLLALAEIAAMRHLTAAIPLIYERMSYGDPSETMRSLRHPIEKIISPDWETLAEICIQLVLTSPHKGARLWAVAELGILQDERAFPILLNALQEPYEFIVCEAISSLHIISRAHPHLRPSALVALKNLTRTWQFGQGRWCSLQSILREIDEIQAMG